MKRVVVALGGNAILRRGQKGTVEEQVENIARTTREIAGLVSNGYRVVITHGNGPQVGNILLQNQAASDQVPPMPMDVCGAESQGMLGYLLAIHLRNALKRIGLSIPVVCLVTQVLVDRNDPSFTNPSKPVGPFFDELHARKRMAECGEKWIEDSGRGWRKVVPSPEPRGIVEIEAIRTLVDSGHIVIAAGGGGIPVVREPDGSLRGVEAVVDKDLSACVLARDLGADALLILTDVNGAAVGYGTPGERWLGTVSLEELKALCAEGHFKEGSMAPKVRAIIRFAESGGTGIIAELGRASEAVSGSTGTVVYPPRQSW